MRVFIEHERSDGAVELTPISWNGPIPQKHDMFVFDGDEERFTYLVQLVTWIAGIEGVGEFRQDSLQRVVIKVGKPTQREPLPEV